VGSFPVPLVEMGMGADPLRPLSFILGNTWGGCLTPWSKNKDKDGGLTEIKGLTAARHKEKTMGTGYERQFPR